MSKYREVHDLTRDELEELKEAYFFELADSGELEEIMPEVMLPPEIPDDVIFEHYAGTEFVKDDFWCNL